MAFNTCKFSYDGVSCDTYGLYYYEISGHSQDDGVINSGFSIVDDQVNRLYRPIHYGVKRGKHMEFDMIFGALEPIDRTAVANIMGWLVGRKQYAPLVIDQPDMQQYIYYAIITTVEMIEVTGLPVAFSAHVVCDSPYAYISYSVSSDGDNFVFNNSTNTRELVSPIIAMNIPSGVRSVLIWFAGQKFCFNYDGDLSGDIALYIDCEACLAEGTIGNQEINVYKYLKDQNGDRKIFFPKMIPGNNNIIIETSGVSVTMGALIPMAVGY